MQHSSGLYHKIKNVSTPEDIEKWLTERKKRYPTKANIDIRKAEAVEKVQRGEIIKQKQDVMKRRKKKVLRHNRKRTTQNRPTQTFCDNVKQKKAYRGVHEFPGTLNLREADLQKEDQCDNEIIENANADANAENINFISDEEEVSVTLAEPVITTTSCIPSLVANYGSSSEESESPEEVPIKKIKTHDDERIKENSIRTEDIKPKNAVVNSRTNEHECSSLQLPASLVSENINIKCKNKQSLELNRHLKDKRQKQTVNKKQPYTSQLLEKLLSRSIQHERNLICQCVKYIVDNNFFDQ